jgi:purine nucleosidase
MTDSKITRYHIDTDMGVDDSLALVIADRLFGPSLTAMSTVFGNVSVDIATRNALILRHLLNRQATLDIFRGAPNASDDFYQSSPAVHGDDGLGGATTDLAHEFLAEVGQDPESRPLAKVATAHEAKRPVTVVGLGPATNIPQLVACYGRTNIERIVLMAGVFFDCGNITPHAEFNAHCDPPALQATLDLGLPVIIVPLDVCRKIQLSRPTVRAYSSANSSALIRLIVKSHMHYMDFYRQAEGIDGCFPHDTVAVLAAMMPQRFYRVRGKVRVDLSAEKRGQTTISPGSESNVEVVTGGDLKWVRDGLATLTFE